MKFVWIHFFSKLEVFKIIFYVKWNDLFSQILFSLYNPIYLYTLTGISANVNKQENVYAEGDFFSLP